MYDVRRELFWIDIIGIKDFLDAGFMIYNVLFIRSSEKHGRVDNNIEY